MMMSAPSLKLWLCGHSHEANLHLVPGTEVRVWLNPIGYPGEKRATKNYGAIELHEHVVSVTKLRFALSQPQPSLHLRQLLADGTLAGVLPELVALVGSEEKE